MGFPSPASDYIEHRLINDAGNQVFDDTPCI